MPNTTNYSFPTPADTDLVKNGADAIRDLGDAVDTAMNTALGTKKAGMVLLNTTSFSGVSSQSLAANTFTSTYTNYKIVLSGLSCSAASTSIQLRLRASSTDSTTGYYYIGYNATTSALNHDTNSNTTGFIVSQITTSVANLSGMTMDLLEPQIATPTKALWSFIGTDSSLATRRAFCFQGFHDVSTAYDSASLVIASGTMTGSVSVYGYNK